MDLNRLSTLGKKGVQEDCRSVAIPQGIQDQKWIEMGTVQTPCVNGLHPVAGICLQNEGYCDSERSSLSLLCLVRLGLSYSSPKLSRLAHLINRLLLIYRFQISPWSPSTSSHLFIRKRMEKKLYF